MKYVVILGDGMADLPVQELGGKTPLECARKPTIDALTRDGILGLVKTVPDGFSPGSDTANLSVMGYDPAVYYSGRSPLEAASLGIAMKETDVIFRCNLVTLSEGDTYEDRVMVDHSSDEISSAEAAILIREIDERLAVKGLRFFPGFGYRHILIWDRGPRDWMMTPPHDILERRVGEYLPTGSGASVIRSITERSVKILENHEINKARKAKGLRPANSVWIWGEGKKPLLSPFGEKYGRSGIVISAVDLIKGIGVAAGLDAPDVKGATGNIHTDYGAKVKAALDALAAGKDFAYVHIEAPDECGHRREVENKVRSIELLDERVVSPIKEALDARGEPYRLMVLPDHPTPLSLRTHTRDPVPFLLYEGAAGKPSLTGPRVGKAIRYDEAAAAGTGLALGKGHALMDIFLSPGIEEALR